MSRQAISRREFLALPLGLLLAPVGFGSTPAHAETESRRNGYAVDVGILYGMLSFHLDGTLTEAIDRAGGRYEAMLAGEGDGIANRIQSIGSLREGRWTPREVHSFFSVKGRESRSDVTYDWARRRVEYHFRGETFFLRKLRVVDDVVAIPEGVHVDDSVTAILNYAEGRWPLQPDGAYQTHVIRRKRAEDENPDDVQHDYRAELAPFVLKVAADPASGKVTGLFDLTRFSSWARRDQPGRITFGRDKRPELLNLAMVLGTSVKIEMRSPELRPS